MATPARVLVVGGHPVIVGVVRLACDASPNLELVADTDRRTDVPGLVRDEDPDVVVLDLDLPGSDIPELFLSVHAGQDGPAILALSDRSDGVTVLNALRGGARGFVVKADGLRSIGDAIERVAGGERVIDPSLDLVARTELGRVARRARAHSGIAGSITPREREVLTLLAEGLTMRQIGSRLGLSPRTVESHVAKLYRKLGVRTRVQAVARAAQVGLIELR
jgi:DNA-binding NarL/FixJ family response regulator